MTDPASTALDRTPARPRRRHRRLRRGRRAGARRGLGEPAVRARRHACGRPTSGSARRSPSGSAGSTRRPTSPSGSPGLEGFGDAVVRRGLHDGGRRRHGRQQPRPGRPRTGRSATQRGLPRAAHPRLDRPGLRVGDARRPRPAADARHRRLASRARRPSRTPSSPTPGRAPRRRSRRVAHHRYEAPGALLRGRSPTRARALEAIAHHDDFREVFLNPPDIGGRYSALTYVGLVPASLIGLDLDALLASALAMLGACREPDPARNPGVSLGLAIGDAGQGRPRQADLPGRRRDRRASGRGSSSSSPRAPASTASGSSRSTSSRSAPSTPTARTGRSSGSSLAGARRRRPRTRSPTALEAAGHPVIRIELADPIDLGAEFVRWEVATAIAGAVLGIDPFDQPNVEEAKQLTRDVLDAVGTARARGGAAGRRADRRRRRPDPATATRRCGSPPATATSSASWRRHLARRRPNAYLASRRSSPRRPARDAAIARIRALLRDRTGRATTAGYGPRFLHSTGQLHKGGAPIGWFLQLTADHPDRPSRSPAGRTPSASSSTPRRRATSRRIESHDLPILRVHLGADPDAGLAALERALAAALDAGTEA